VTAPEDLSAALAIHRAGRLAEADALYRRILETSPRHAEALRLRGVLACQEGRFAEAVGLLEAAIGLNGDIAVYHSNLGVALKGGGKAEEALGALRRAQALAPQDSDIQYNIACLLQELDRPGDAAAAYDELLTANPDHADALSNLGLLLLDARKPDQALPLLQRALALDPGLLPARINLGLALHELQRHAEAAAVFRQALAVAPERADLHFNLANALHADRRYEEAIAQGERAVSLEPVYAEAHHNIGNAWRELGDTEQAVSRYRKALSLRNDYPAAWRNLLATLLYRPGVSAAERFSEHRRFAAGYPSPAASTVIADNPERPLRIGYVSSDLRQHPVARNLEPIFLDRHPDGWITAAYADIRYPDDVTERFRAAVDLWRPIMDLTDDAVVEQIRNDRIDILVHLAGRFDRNRPTIAAGRAAPVQISFHDPATSGFAAVDYLIADRFLVPRSATERFSERVLRLPSFYTHAPLIGAPDPAPPPADTERPITFASFNHPAKLNPVVLALWGRILASVPGSRLLLRHRHRFSNPTLQQRVLSGLAGAGIGADRVSFNAGDTAREDHLRLYQQADIALDPFPFTGSTTTFEALWMGVPVVTLADSTMVGRWSSSILHAVDLDELIAASEVDYAAIASSLARDRRWLVELRRSLRPRLEASPLCNGALRARQIARLYRAVWRHWCAKGSAAGEHRVGVTAA